MSANMVIITIVSDIIINLNPFKMRERRQAEVSLSRSCCPARENGVSSKCMMDEAGEKFTFEMIYLYAFLVTRCLQVVGLDQYADCIGVV